MTSPFDDPEVRKFMAEHGIVHEPGSAKKMLDQIAPLLADDGIDLDDLDTTDLDTVNAALARATERHNLTLFTPVGKHRSLALSVLRTFTVAIADDDLAGARAIADSVPRDETDTMPAASHVIGVALGVLDSRHADPATAPVSARVRVPAWPDRSAVAAARDIVALADKRRAFDSLDSLIVRHHGKSVMVGAALAVAASVLAEARATSRDAVQTAASVLTEGKGADAVIPAPTGAAFRRAVDESVDDDEALVREFRSWLESQGEIVAPDVSSEIKMFRSLQLIARGWEVDLRDPDDVEDFIAMLCEEAESDDSYDALLNALETVDDYIHMRIETAVDPMIWEGPHEAVQDELAPDKVSAQVLHDALASAEEIPEKQRHAAVKDLLVVRGVPALLEWIGSGRAVSSTQALRRADIQEVASMIGISAMGVNKKTRGGDPLQVSSMGEIPLLTAWWSALAIASVTELTSTRVRLGGSAELWRSAPSFEVAEFLAGLVAAEIMTDSYFDTDNEDEREIVADTVAHVVAALGDGIPEEFSLAALRMRTLEQAGFVARDADGTWIVPDALRATVARAVMMVIATHLAPGAVEALLAGDE